MKTISFRLAETLMADSWKRYCWDWFMISSMGVLVKYGGIPHEKAFETIYVSGKSINDIVDYLHINVFRSYQGTVEFENVTKTYYAMISHGNHVSWAESMQK